MTAAWQSSQPNPPAVCGGARLRYIRTERGTQLSEQWVSPPLHMAKAYPQKDWLISLLTSPTAGLLAGDRLAMDCSLASNARVALVSPAACRVHRMKEGKARLAHNYNLAENAVLDVWPAPLILQADAVLEQETTLQLAKSATLLLVETISPGRVAYGESFQFKRWTSRLRIFRAGQLISYENFRLEPHLGDGLDWRQRYPNGSYASIYYVSPKSIADLVDPLHALEIESASIGASRLSAAGLGVKILAADGIALRKAIFSVRSLLILNSQVSFPEALKRAQTFYH